MKNLLLFSLILLIGFSSCSKSNELVVSSDDVQLLQNYVEEANSLVDVVGEIDGNVSAIFYTAAVTNNSCEGDVITQGGMDEETEMLLNDIVDKMGFESTRDIHDWMVDAGKILSGIKEVSIKNFDSERDMIIELACLVSPEIMTRSSSESCHKDNLVKLFAGTMAAGIRYGTSKKELSETACSSRGSSFNKIWLFMKNSIDCE